MKTKAFLMIAAAGLLGLSLSGCVDYGYPFGGYGGGYGYYGAGRTIGYNTRSYRPSRHYRGRRVVHNRHVYRGKTRSTTRHPSSSNHSSTNRRSGQHSIHQP